MQTTQVTYEDYWKMASKFEYHHKLFSTMWQMGSPNFSEDIDIDTARTICTSTVRLVFSLIFLLQQGHRYFHWLRQELE